MNRSCGGCTLCCKLLPVKEIGKGANTRCKHQQTGVGCRVYNTSPMPLSCRVWTCRWLSDPKTANLSRPDRSRYVLDIMPDQIQATNEDTGEEVVKDVIQVWCDPDHPDAYRDPALLDYLYRMFKEYGAFAIIRYNSTDAFVLIPPDTAGGEWTEHRETRVHPDYKFLGEARHPWLPI